jgi:hypothetical protein
MKFPSKVTPFKNSTLGLLPKLLSLIKAGDISPISLLGKIKGEIGSASNFLDALDCLFALRKIELNEQTGDLHYVD